MKIIIAQTAGFCFGVERAVEMAFTHSDEANTYTYGPIIHNEVVTNRLEAKGVSVMQNLQELTEKKAQQLIIRSHGVGPEVYQKAESEGIKVIDATCPYVKKIHRYVQKYQAKGYHILIAGNCEHPEVQGINGWGQGNCIIAKDVQELEQIALPTGRYLVVAQTTYKKQVVEEMLAYLEKQKIDFEFVNTICNATKERQEEAKLLAEKVDCMLVLGSPSSANTRKLYEISQTVCKQCFCLQGAEMLSPEMFIGCETVGITAGASTPASVIEETVAWIEKLTS